MPDPSSASITVGPVSGVITLTATPAASLAVASLQFQIDDSNTGPILTSAPYTTNYRTLVLSNGDHVITALVTDSDGNTSTSAPCSVTVYNDPNGPRIPPR